jgi:NADPH:quinone reductase-like Zn-dependent oxidoreductase
MQAIQAIGDGRVRLEETEDPAPRPGHAIVRVAAFSINRGEIYQLEQPRPGWRPGKDLAGTVVGAAPDGSGPGTGTRVVGHADDSAWAEHALVPISRLAELPDQVSLVTAAALPLAGLAALRLVRLASPLSSRRVLLTGASGGLGHYFVELAAGQGAVVTAITASEERGQRLRELGAATVIHDVDEAAGPFDVAIESVGGPTTKAVWHQLEQHGMMLWIGQASRIPPQLDYFDWDGAMSVTIRKFNYMDSTHTEAEDLATLVRLVSTGRLHPELGLVEDWTRVNDAIRALRDRIVRGNAVLTVGGAERSTEPRVISGTVD